MGAALDEDSQCDMSDGLDPQATPPDPDEIVMSHEERLEDVLDLPCIRHDRGLTSIKMMLVAARKFFLTILAMSMDRLGLRPARPVL